MARKRAYCSAPREDTLAKLVVVACIRPPEWRRREMQLRRRVRERPARWPRRAASSPGHLLCLIGGPLFLLGLVALLWRQGQPADCMLMLASRCLANCSCSWRGGKFVADCSALALTRVPKVSVGEYLWAPAKDNSARLQWDINAILIAKFSIPNSE